MSASRPLLQRLEKMGIRLGLDPMRALLAALGGPEDELPVVLVGGSNGKGSTAAILASILRCSGLKVGLFTSPHLVHATERLRVNGECIDDGVLASLLTEVVAASESATGAPPTHFEALTVAALLHFRRSELDLAIFEVGMGGRLDATNCTHPVLSLLTSFALEHQQYLGESLAEIAEEKAGILRGGQRAWAWAEDRELRTILGGLAERLDCRLKFLPDSLYTLKTRTLDWQGQELSLTLPDGRSFRSRLPLLGAHQARNAMLAILGAEELRKQGFSGISREAVEKGLESCRWPGRLELLKRADQRWLLLDGAHNPDAAAALASFLEARDERFDLVFGALDDKDARAMLAALEPQVKRIFLTEPSSPRARPAESLARGLAACRTEVLVPAERALDRALESASGGGRVLVTGSLYLVGEIRDLAKGLGFEKA